LISATFRGPQALDYHRLLDLSRGLSGRIGTGLHIYDEMSSQTRHTTSGTIQSA
jgi:hypothetical protein